MTAWIIRTRIEGESPRLNTCRRPFRSPYRPFVRAPAMRPSNQSRATSPRRSVGAQAASHTEDDVGLRHAPLMNLQQDACYENMESRLGGVTQVRDYSEAVSPDRRPCCAASRGEMSYAKAEEEPASASRTNTPQARTRQPRTPCEGQPISALSTGRPPIGSSYSAAPWDRVMSAHRVRLQTGSRVSVSVLHRPRKFGVFSKPSRGDRSLARFIQSLRPRCSPQKPRTKLLATPTRGKLNRFDPCHPPIEGPPCLAPRAHRHQHHKHHQHHHYLVPL